MSNTTAVEPGLDARTRQDLRRQVHLDRLRARLSEIGVEGDVGPLAEFVMSDEVVRTAVASTLDLMLERREPGQVRLVSEWADSVQARDEHRFDTGGLYNGQSHSVGWCSCGWASPAGSPDAAVAAWGDHLIETLLDPLDRDDDDKEAR